LFLSLIIFWIAVGDFVFISTIGILPYLAAPVFALGLVVVSLLRAHDHRRSHNMWFLKVLFDAGELDFYKHSAR